MQCTTQRCHWVFPLAVPLMLVKDIEATCQLNYHQLSSIDQPKVTRVVCSETIISSVDSHRLISEYIISYSSHCSGDPESTPPLVTTTDISLVMEAPSLTAISVKLPAFWTSKILQALFAQVRPSGCSIRPFHLHTHHTSTILAIRHLASQKTKEWESLAVTEFGDRLPPEMKDTTLLLHISETQNLFFFRFFFRSLFKQLLPQPFSHTMSMFLSDVPC